MSDLLTRSIDVLREADALRIRQQTLEEAALACEAFGARFGRLAEAFGVGKSDHAQGGDLAALKALTAEECAAAVRALKEQG